MNLGSCIAKLRDLEKAANLSEPQFPPFVEGEEQ